MGAPLVPFTLLTKHLQVSVCPCVYDACAHVPLPIPSKDTYIHTIIHTYIHTCTYIHIHTYKCELTARHDYQPLVKALSKLSLQYCVIKWKLQQQISTNRIPSIPPLRDLFLSSLIGIWCSPINKGEWYVIPRPPPMQLTVTCTGELHTWVTSRKWIVTLPTQSLTSFL